jgi:ParB family chromosome partitioning protein
MLALKTIVSAVRDCTPEEVMWIRAIENVQRKDLSPFEEGHMYIKMRDERGFSVDQIAKKMGKSPGVIQRRIDIMSMPESFQRALHQKKIGIGVAEELMACPDGARREYFLDLAIEHGITTAVARMWVDDFKKSLRQGPDGAGGGGAPGLPYENKPIYTTCQICEGPVDWTQVIHLTICPDCGRAIFESVKKSG